MNQIFEQLIASKNIMYDNLKPYVNKGYYVHFSTINKVGINPKFFYGNPPGIYLYPINDYVLDCLVNNKIYMKMQFERKGYLYFPSSTKYGFVIKTQKLVDVLSYNNLESDLVKLLRFNIKPKKYYNIPFKTLYSAIKNHVQSRRSTGITHILRELGYNGIKDIKDKVLFGGPQAVVFSTKHLKILHSFLVQKGQKHTYELVIEDIENKRIVNDKQFLRLLKRENFELSLLISTLAHFNKDTLTPITFSKRMCNIIISKCDEEEIIESLYDINTTRTFIKQLKEQNKSKVLDALQKL
jgi:hypothetical protein